MVFTPSRYLNWFLVIHYWILTCQTLYRSYSLLDIDMSNSLPTLNHDDVRRHDSTVHYIFYDDVRRHDSSKLIKHNNLLNILP